MNNNVSENINNDSITVFAETNFRNQKVRFGIKKDDRRRHMYLVGKTGMGKSVTLEHMIYSDINVGNGLALVDPHGDLAEKVLNFIPSNRINDVVYFDPSDIEYPIAFNILESVQKDKQHLIASGLIGVFKKIWAESWGPRLEYLLRNVILALLDYEGSTLLGVMRILVDKEYRKLVIQHIKDPIVKTFWTDEYSRYPEKFQVEAIAPIQNKVGQFLSNSLIRNIVGQVKSSINVREIMDQKKILILNLSKGHVGEDTAALIGAMMITKIQLAAMERIDMPEKDRLDFYLYVDEFQNFATDSFASILSEARKYRLCLIMAHQYIAQLSETVQPAVFGNVGTLICFRVGALDAAEVLATEFAPRFTEEDLVNLSKYEMYLKLMIDGVASEAFSARTLPPIINSFNNNEKIIKVSREHYASQRVVIEEKIARWAEKQAQTEVSDTQPKIINRRFNPSLNQDNFPKDRFSSKPYSALGHSAAPVIPANRIAGLSPKHNTQEIKHFSTGYKATDYREQDAKIKVIKKYDTANNNRTIWYPAICARCGIKTEVPFPVDGKKIPYCKQCLKIVYAQKTENKALNIKPNTISAPVNKIKEDSQVIVQSSAGNDTADQRTPTTIIAQDNTIKNEDSVVKDKVSAPTKLAPGEIIKLKSID